MHVLFIVKRNSEDTWAVVEADVPESKDDKNNASYQNCPYFLDTLGDALTEWVKTTDEGREAWELSCRDFNVGDLSQYIGDLWLTKTLEKHKISNLRIAIHSFDNTHSDCWYYDRILVDTSRLPKKMRERT